MSFRVGQSAQRTPSFGTDEQRWSAVQRREPGADGAFFYSVRTTGVYCRPTCSARLPRRHNVAFHDSTAAAERAGFRACKRCRPNDAPLADRRAAAIADACRLIETAPEVPSVAALAAAASMSRFHFQRVFKELTGSTPKAYAAARRAGRARDELSRGKSVTDALYAAGFNSSSRFYAEASRSLGMTPRAYRNGGAGIAMRFAVAECSLGSILVAATQKGVCAILLGDDPHALVRDLEDRFRDAALEPGDAAFDAWVAQVIGLVESPGVGLDLPLDVRGTAFQQRVWRALCDIPLGSTATYAEVAARIGAGGSARAVARACAANGLAVAIPCHRVVRSDGDLSGYRWGVERKRALLARERAAQTAD